MEDEVQKPRIATARKLARNLISESGVKAPPVLIKVVASFLIKTRSLQILGWDFADKTSGVQVTKDSAPFIGYNKNHHPHRQRFTVAHEIGHLLLGHTHADSVNDPDGPGETEANQFAAELLMPLAMLKADIETGTKQPKVLSQRYFVSEESMWNRLKDCKLLNKI